MRLGLWQKPAKRLFGNAVSNRLRRLISHVNGQDIVTVTSSGKNWEVAVVGADLVAYDKLGLQADGEEDAPPVVPFPILMSGTVKPN